MATLQYIVFVVGKKNLTPSSSEARCEYLFWRCDVDIYSYKPVEYDIHDIQVIEALFCVFMSLKLISEMYPLTLAAFTDKLMETYDHRG